MIRKKTERKEKPIIDLDGPEGNAYVLLGYVGDLGNQLGFSSDKIKNIRKEMQEGDYENLLSVFDNYFGEFVILERS
jgi:hypothetical protein